MMVQTPAPSLCFLPGFCAQGSGRLSRTGTAAVQAVPPAAQKAPLLLGSRQLLWASQEGSLHPKLAPEHIPPSVLSLAPSSCTPGSSKEKHQEQTSGASHWSHPRQGAASSFLRGGEGTACTVLICKLGRVTVPTTKAKARAVVRTHWVSRAPGNSNCLINIYG